MISKFNDLGQSVTTLYSNVARMEEQNKNNTEKLLAKNQDMERRVSGVITQAMAKTDAQITTLNTKLNSTGQKVQENQENTKLANQKLTKLIEILKTLVTTQGKRDDVDKLVGEITGLKAEQAAIKEALEDLRRKANVNIARNNDIKKAQKEIKSAVKEILSR